MNTLSIQNNRTKRNIILLVGLIFLTIFQTWSGTGIKEAPKPAQVTGPSMELALFNWVAKILVGSKSIIQNRDNSLQDPGVETAPKIVDWLKSNQTIASYLEPSLADNELGEDVLIGKTILAGHENLRSQYAELRVKAGRRSTNTSIDLLGIVDKVYSSKDLKPRLTPEFVESFKEPVQTQMGWIGKILYIDALNQIAPTEAESLLKKTYAEAREKAVTFGFLFIGGSLLLGLGFICLMVWIVKIAFSDFKLGGIKITIPSIQLLEVFILYLAALNILFYWSASLEMNFESKIKITSLGTLALSLLAVYPVFKGSNFKQTLNSIGLWPLPGFSSILSGPIFVAAMWPVFTLLLSFYQSLLAKLSVDITKGQHPVVPVFLTADSEQSLSWLFIFAAVVAPIVEEIMFRGALYGWLRDNYGKFISIVLSSFIFAIIHPQGALGIVPLSLIGCGLAFIREWRGSLIPCMLAHSLVNGTVLTIIFQLR
jgi:membrane protease YdiL (CAAX protease family)